MSQFFRIIFLILLSMQSISAVTNIRQSDVAGTKHNLSATGFGTTTATTESQICAFCHTPHGANSSSDAVAIGAPLWNRALSNETYVKLYESNSMQAVIDANPGGSSKLCLSCHDGTLALGDLNVINGSGDPLDVDMTSTRMPDGTGALTGFTRNLGTDLSGDHPISFTFDTTLANLDRELTNPDITRTADFDRKSKITPLDDDGKVQCTTCHDPHVRGIDDPNNIAAVPGGGDPGNIKFLRARRFQMADPVDGQFTLADDIICLQCHNKSGWAESVHANQSVADKVYDPDAAAIREFPTGIQVWQAACLNCHDTHTVQGANKLLREGTDGAEIGGLGSGTPRTGGKAALENTCYQCHGNDSILTLPPKNIENEFGLKTRMPITEYNATNTKELHDITDADFSETRAKLGFGAANIDNRHVECTDCHNPHRMVRKYLAEDISPGVDLKGTHRHESGIEHSNKISGVLKGTWGVEPVYGSSASGGRKFGRPSGRPTGFDVLGVRDAASPGNYLNGPVTAEYQICLKCHSNFGYADNGEPEGGAPTGRPQLPAAAGTGLTQSDSGYKQTNSLDFYTNQAMEFQAPGDHACENCSLGTDGGAYSLNTNNHRSWHPVMAPTGRSASSRGANASSWIAPFNTGTGSQTMYCTDCHGASNGSASNVEPSGTDPWGPHGSSRNFILKGDWLRGSANRDATGNMLCFKCHSYNTYNGDNREGGSGFQTSGGDGGHSDIHKGAKIGMDLDCMWCHVAVPHGWKNRSLLVNLNDIGPEVLCRPEDNSVYNVTVPAGMGEGGGNANCKEGEKMPAGTSVPTNSLGGSTGYSNPPYYINARLRLNGMPQAGSTWSENNCGGVGGGMTSACDDNSGY